MRRCYIQKSAEVHPAQWCRVLFVREAWQPIFIAGLLLAWLAAVLPASAAPAYPLKASANGRYLVDSNGVPCLLTGDSPQALFVKLTEAEAGAFLTNRAALGFNTLWVNLLCTTNNGGLFGGLTTNGIAPFTNTIAGTEHYDLTAPNEAYFAHVDRVLHLAAQLGIQIMLDPLETSVNVWTAVALTNGVTRCRAYGQYLGNRYRNFDNLIWWSGNDFQDWADPASDAVVRAVALGIQDTDTRHLHTLMLDYPVSGSLDNTNWTSILGLNASYTYWPTYAQVLKDYNRPNAIPTFMAEAHYEDENLYEAYGNPEVMRRQSYWSLLSGACGQLMGNHYTWQFLAGWQTNMNTTGSLQMAHVNSLFGSRRWFDLVPDQSHVVLTGGYGMFAAAGTLTNNTYATAARTLDGVLFMAYLPTLRTVTVDMTKLSAEASGQWFDPANGAYVAIAGSPFANTGVRTFTPPGTNSLGAGDWVLVIEVEQPDSAPPISPAELTARAVGLNQINLQWSAATDNIGVYRYALERCAGADCDEFAALASVAGTNFADSGLAPGTIYRYRVAALDAATNTSPYSAVATVRTWSAPPSWSGLVAEYGFDEAAGLVAGDASGQDNTGSISGAAWLAAGKFNGALLFDGLDFVGASDSPSLQLTNALTLEAWVYPTDLPAGWSCLVIKETTTGFAYALQADAQNRPNLQVTTSTGPASATSATPLTLNAWTHVAGTFNGETLSLFMNGELIATNTVSGSLVPSTGPLCIGGSPALGGFFKGRLDGVRLYDRALAVAEIPVNMNRAAGARPVITLSPRAQTYGQIRESGYHFDLSADGPVAVVVEATSDLITWQSIATLQYTNGLAGIVDFPGVLPALAFYRIRSTSGAPAVTLGVPVQTAGQIAATGFKLSVEADQPAALVIERTVDFVIWQAVRELVYTNGLVEVVDPVLQVPAARFYRARAE